MVKCKYCNKEFKQLHYHLRSIHNVNPDTYDGKLLSDELILKYNNINSGKNNPRYGTNIKFKKETKIRYKKFREDEVIKKNGKIEEFEVICYNCGIKFKIKEREKLFPIKEKYFCSIHCAHSRKNVYTEEMKKKISDGMKKVWKNDEYRKKQANNNTSKNKRFTSIGEREIRKYFIDNYPEDNWTFGGNLKIENSCITRDLFSKKLKICIEYDGIWHFKDIHGQLKNKQLKDKLLKQWCIKNNYRLIRIKDELYMNNRNKYLNILINEVYNKNDKLVYIY